MSRPLFCCPTCSESLYPNDHAWVCPKRHSFDRARQGYVNLLTANRSAGKIPGDNKQMVDARRDFLEKGYYQPLSDGVNRLCAELLRGNEVPWILDAGCGEGYYTGRLREFLAEDGKRPTTVGVDISKFALAAASRSYPEISFAVASLFHLPAQADGFDILLNLFAPCCEEEFARVLKPGGALIMVIPSPRHLWQLKAAVYDTPYPNDGKPYALERFSLEDKRSVDAHIFLPNQQDISSLFSMTPYFYKTSVEGSRRAAALTELETEIGFELLCYRKKAE